MRSAKFKIGRDSERFQSREQNFKTKRERERENEQKEKELF